MIELPASIWANVLDYLYHHEQIDCCLVNKRFVDEICPLVTQIVVVQSSNLVGSAVRRRFSDSVTHVAIMTFFHLPEDGGDIDPETNEHAIDFLCDFPKLKYAFVGNRRDRRIFDYYIHWTGRRLHFEHNPTQLQLQQLHRFIRRACEAISSGRINKQGLNRLNGFLPFTCIFQQLHNNDGVGEGDNTVRRSCPTCYMIGKHFPLKQVCRQYVICGHVGETYDQSRGGKMRSILSSRMVSVSEATELLVEDIETRSPVFFAEEEIRTMIDYGANQKDPRIRKILLCNSKCKPIPPRTVEMLIELGFNVSKNDFFRLNPNDSIVGYHVFSAEDATNHLYRQISKSSHTMEGGIELLWALLGAGADARDPRIRDALLENCKTFAPCDDVELEIPLQDFMIDFYVAEFDVTREELSTGIDSRKRQRIE